MKSAPIICIVFLWLGSANASQTQNHASADRTPPIQTESQSDAREVFQNKAVRYFHRQWRGYTEDKKHNNYDKTIAALTIVILFLQWLTYRRQARISHVYTESNMEIERCWVVPSSIALFASRPENNTDAIWRPFVTVGWLNSGRTPARLVESCVALTSYNVRNSLPPRPVYPRTQIFRFDPRPIVAPQAQQPPIPIIVPLDRMIAQADLERFRIGEEIMAFYGYIQYSDVFKKMHITRFCLLYHVPTPADPLPEQFRWGGPATYNEQT